VIWISTDLVPVSIDRFFNRDKIQLLQQVEEDFTGTVLLAFKEDKHCLSTR